MRLFPLFALASLPLLGACQVIGLHPARLEPQRIAWEQHAAGCQGERCSLVNVDTLKFAEQPRLNALIEQALLALTQGSAGGPAPATLRDYAREQLRQPRWGDLRRPDRIHQPRALPGLDEIQGQAPLCMEHLRRPFQIGT